MKRTGFPSAALITCIALASCSAGADQNRQPSSATSAQQPAAKEEKQRAPVDPNRFALIVAGAGGEEQFTKKFTSQVMRLYDAVTTRLGFDEKHVFLLTENLSGGPEEGTRANFARASAEEVKRALGTIKSAANAESLVLVVLVGHGSSDNQQPKFNLVGPDLAAKDYAALFTALPTKRVVFVNCASSSGDFVKPLSGEGRIVITATRSGNEQNATVFAEHFIGALTEAAADGDKNGRVSVLEAFTYTTKQTADWYKQKDRLATEHALVDDNGDGVGHEEATAGDGALAKTTYLDAKSIEIAGSDAELARLLAEKQKVEEAIEKLKVRKAEMKEDEYTNQLEELLVRLAHLTQAIKAKQK
jgi:hypothetical protein